MLFSLILYLNNMDIILCKLWSLTQVFTNIILSVAITNLITKKKNPLFFIVSALGCVTPNTVLPLSNTLFSLHPPLLTFSVIYCILSLQRVSTSNWNCLTLLSISMFGGGFWSTQELNWGGWWNWDVLEIGSLIIWVIMCIGTHYTFSKVLRLKWGFACTWAALTFYSLNKTGIGVSIHSFITSNTLKCNYLGIIFFFNFIGVTLGLICSLTLISIVFIYSGATSFASLKFFLVNLIFYTYLKSRSWQENFHKVLQICFLFLLIINTHNLLITTISITHQSIAYIFIGTRFNVIYQNQKHSWLTGWRSKPLITWNIAFSSQSSRSPSGGLYQIAYPK